jgi:beta-lactamase regulating signal transducer with metallopeptidase domain
MNALHLLTGPVAQALGWALLHLLWQATIVAGILAAVLALMSKQRANARYAVSCGALGLVFVLFVATAVRAYDPAVAPIAEETSASDSVRISLTQIPVLLAQSAAEGAKDRVVEALTAAREALPSIVAIWLAGVLLLSARLMVSWIRARRLVRVGAQPASDELQLTAIRLSNALGLRSAVKLLQSASVEVPSVMGTIRPIILVPASALTGMTPEQIEMVLAHELAHIRRHDFLVNLLQAVVETLMFYHPAVWWMSRRVRVERENCCDDLAVAVCGNPIQYARALTRLEELRASALPVVVAASGGSLLDRIRRIAAGSDEGTAANARWAAAMVMLGILVAGVAVPSLPALAQRGETAKKADAPKIASAQVDVVESASEENSDDVEYELAGEDVEIDLDLDVDIDVPDVPEVPEAPEAPELALLDMIDSIAPTPAVPPVPGAPAAAPAPRAWPVPVARPGRPAPPAPVIAAFDADRAFDFEFDFEHEPGDGKDSRPLGEGGKLTVDELISLRAVGVTPEFVNTMRGLFPGLTLRDVTSLKAVGVTTEFVRQMRSAGFEVKAAREATSLRAVGVTPEFVQQMRAAGLEVKTARQATSLRAVGVTAEFVSEMRAAGLAVSDAKDLAGLAAVGVTRQWLSEMKAAGVDVTNARDAQRMRAVGVTADFVRRLAKAGYTNLTPRELARMAAVGIDDDFIREMDQYRKKN